MKTFELKSSRKKLFVVVLLIVFGTAAIAALEFFPWMSRNGYENVSILVFVAILGIAGVTLKKILVNKYTIKISDLELIILRNSRIQASTPLNEIAMIKYITTGLRTNILTIYTSGKKTELARFEAMQQTQVFNNIIDELISQGDYECNDTYSKHDDIRTYNYINKDVVLYDDQVIKKVQAVQKSGKTKMALIITGIFIVLLGATIVPFFINPKAFYEIEDRKVYFGDKEMTGVNPKETRVLSYSVLKDSSHIYYRGEILEWADRATFQCIREPFYMDKNGLYYEKTSFYSKNKIIPMEGDYDKKTFHSLGYSSFFYKDKNSLYHLQISLVLDKNPLRKVEIPGLDVASFEITDNSNWYTDKNRVYFNTWDELRPCPEIDLASFQVVSHTVVKDKNHVYYLTRDLSSDEKAATQKEDYATLGGADAPSFKKVDEKNYKDKNTTWRIRTEGVGIEMNNN